MMRSMFSGISGLRSHQTMMDVVGNNISNVNTAGFKASVVTFQEALYQTLQGPGTASDSTGGSNPLQIGLGTRVASIDSVFTQGASQVTGRNTDLAIQGDGFFVLDVAGQRNYTRAGNFSFDSAGNLTAPGGARVMGWMTDATTGEIDFSKPLAALNLPLTSVIDPVLTSLVSVGGNLPADAAVGDDVVTTITIFDSLGNPHELVLTFTKNAANDWTLAAEVDGTAATLSNPSITFGPDGALTSASPINLSGVTPAGADPLSFDLELDTDTPLVQFGGRVSMAAFEQDGNGIGFLRNFAIADDGSVVGQFSNGWTKLLGAVAVSTFTNPTGLMKVGESRYQESINSGPPLVGSPGDGGRGILSAGTLEMSNVDLAQEFTNMIIAQRGFQANSRIITASDEILADLVNMKR
jgi:flagellar hook protein FlgE